MADRTLGQRIGDRRRQLRLSQEGLGGLLEVTGRTVAKWESDIVIPDAASLQALSQALEVSTGWLLGLEPLPEEDPTQMGIPRFLSEPQLEQVEELIRRYSEQFPSRGRAGSSRFALLLAVIAFVAALFALAHAQSRLDSFTQELDSLSKANAALQQQLEALTEQLNLLEDAPRGEQLLTGYQISASSNESGTGALITFVGTPAKTSPGDQIFLEARLEGSDTLSVSCHQEDSAYTAVLELPAADGYSYQLSVLHRDGSTDSQLLNSKSCVDEFAEDVARGLQPTLKAGLQWEPKGTALRFKSCDLELAPPGLTTRTDTVWLDAELVFYKNDEQIQQVSLRKYIQYLTGTDGSNRLAGVVYPEISPVTMESGDLLEVRLLGTLSDGAVLEKPVLRLVCEKPGSYTELPLSA